MKQFLISILMIAVLLNVCACNPDHGSEASSGSTSSSSTSSSSTQTKPDPDPTKTVYGVLNDLTKQSYSKIKLGIATETGGIELTAEYILAANTVSYSVEQMNLLPEDGNFGNLSPEAKTVLKGTATVENGKITKLDGDRVTLPAYDELKGSFDFREGYFVNVRSGEGMFSADVKSASEFLGTDKELTGMKIEVKYGTSTLEKITLTYRTSDSTVKTVYEFER